MITITFSSKEREVQVIVTERMAERIINLMYPNKGLNGVSKGYIELVNIVHGSFPEVIKK